MQVGVEIVVGGAILELLRPRPEQRCGLLAGQGMFSKTRETFTHGHQKPLVVDGLVLESAAHVVWCDAAKFRGASSVSSWIFGIAYNRAVSALRKELRHRRSIDGSVK